LAEQPWERLGELEEYRLLARARLGDIVGVREPLVLISQAQRSGGTLLSQLFDGHPECHAHPSEIHIGHPSKWDWPPLELRRPESWFEMLYERPAGEQMVRGYRKSKHGGEVDILPFLFSPRLEKEIFDACVAARPIGNQRAVLDCYFTAYFNAWLDNHNLYSGPKKIVTGFTPRLTMDPANTERFFAAYPDGAIISIVRDPRGWYASAHTHKRDYLDVEEALALWRRSAEAALDGAARRPGRVLLLTFEQLVQETETTMGRLTERLGIAMSPVLLTPTFNMRPIRANSSDTVDRYGILAERADAYRESLDSPTIARIDELAGDLYERVAALDARC
jgi:hypothetical protein